MMEMRAIEHRHVGHTHRVDNEDPTADAAIKDPFRGGGYPALYDSTSRASRIAQSEYLWALRVKIAGTIAGAVGGALLISLGFVVIGASVAIVGFTATLLSEFWVLRQAPERVWYEGRAAAESTKTLAWRYAVRGAPFEQQADDSAADAEFLTRTRELMNDLDNVRASMGRVTTEAITLAMRSIRALPFAERKAIYRNGRIEDQQAWYRDKAAANRRLGVRWSIALIVAEGLGLAGGIVVLTTAWPVDLLGVFAALAAATTAWIQAKQYRNLETAYVVAALELASVKSELDAIIDEDAWGAFVAAAEEAVSREHTLWRASRGSGKGRPRV